MSNNNSHYASNVIVILVICGNYRIAISTKSVWNICKTMQTIRVW